MKFSIPEQSATAESPTGPVLVRPYQVVVPVSLWVSSYLSPRFPAVLDTGHSHNFSIRRDIPFPGNAGILACSCLRCPEAGKDACVPRGVSLRTPRCPEGIAVYPDNHPSAPRLPLLGLRAIVRNGITVVIHGAKKEVTIG